MAVSGRGHGDPCRKIEELVTIYVFDHNATAALGNQRIGARVRRRNEFFVARKNALGVGAGKRFFRLRAGNRCSGVQFLGGHGNPPNRLSVSCSQLFSDQSRASTEITRQTWELKAKAKIATAISGERRR